jgi:two-component system sensor histidine kinase/response regulator
VTADITIPGHETSPLDLKVVAALRVIGPGKLLRQTGEDFLAEAPATFEELERHAEKGDAVGVARAAHRLKGVSGHMGARGLANATARLEQRTRDGGRLTFDDLAEARAELGLAVEAVARLLR